MNKDLVIGILVSLLLHGGFFGFEYLFPKGKAKIHAAKIDEERMIQFDMPVEEPEKPDKVEDLDEPPPETVMAPPSLQDVPTVVPVDAFTTPITPPPPPGLVTDRSAISIPVVRTNSFGKGIKDLFNPADLDQQVQARVKVGPTYPSDLKRQGISGQAIVEFIVDTNGNVTAAQIVRSTHREFEAPSLAAILKWKFRPGKKGGRTVNVRVQQPFDFTPTED